MNPLLKLIPEMEDFLESVKKSMISDLEFFIKRESSNPNLRMFSFIYSFEDFKTVVYSMDKKGNTITDVVGLPIKDYDNLYADVNYGRFIPYELEEKEEEIHDQYMTLDDKEKISEFWEYREEYDEKKEIFFEDWFKECWKIASSNTKTNILTSFAMHDSLGGLELNTGKHMSDEDISNFFD